MNGRNVRPKARKASQSDEQHLPDRSDRPFRPAQAFTSHLCHQDSLAAKTDDWESSAGRSSRFGYIDIRFGWGETSLANSGELDSSGGKRIPATFGGETPGFSIFGQSRRNLNPKSEYRNPKQIPNSKSKITRKYVLSNEERDGYRKGLRAICLGHFPFWSFEFVSDFDIRISCFESEIPASARAC